MDKKQAEQEILRRLGIYLSKTYVKNYSAIAELVLYDCGRVSKQELIKMITLDENDNLLSEPEYTIGKKGTKIYSVGSRWIEEWKQARKKATKIVNCYDGNC